MSRHSHFYFALILLLSFLSLCALQAADKSSSFFKYATPLQTPPVSSPALAELRFTDEMYESLREDFADLRIVSRQERGVVPAKVAPAFITRQDSSALSRRNYLPSENPPPDLAERYAGNSILAFRAGRAPVSRVDLARGSSMPRCGYMLLGRSSVHAAGSEWRLLARGTVEGSGEQRMTEEMKISFPEARCRFYAFVFDDAEAARHCSVAGVLGPDYSVYFQLRPNDSYNLLCGYPGAPPVAAFSTIAVDRLLQAEEAPLSVRVGSLVPNEHWRGTSLKKFAFSRSFLIPLSVVAALVVLLLVFVVVVSVVNRKRPVKLEPRPRFFK